MFPHVRRGFEGEAALLVFDYFPFRVQYVLTEWYGVEERRARNAVQRFLRQPVRVVSADRETLLEAYEVNVEKNHDIYNAFVVALARHHEADTLLTTDTDFEGLCDGEAFEYLNPVPTGVFAEFRTGLRG